jgi:DNA mismatch endonuclease (patch repair protein)
MAKVEDGSWASSPGVRRSMQSNRPRDTALETAVRSALHRDGLRFRKHVRPVAGLACTVDVLFPTEMLAVFVDGCYWHACPEHASYPRTNRAWWGAKLEGTQERDRRNADALQRAGWHVLRVWEHEDVAIIVRKVRNSLDGLRRARS